MITPSTAPRWGSRAIHSDGGRPPPSSPLSRSVFFVFMVTARPISSRHRMNSSWHRTAAPWSSSRSLCLRHAAIGLLGERQGACTRSRDLGDGPVELVQAPLKGSGGRFRGGIGRVHVRAAGHVDCGGRSLIVRRYLSQKRVDLSAVVAAFFRTEGARPDLLRSKRYVIPPSIAQQGHCRSDPNERPGGSTSRHIPGPLVVHSSSRAALNGWPRSPLSARLSTPGEN